MRGRTPARHTQEALDTRADRAGSLYVFMIEAIVFCIYNCCRLLKWSISPCRAERLKTVDCIGYLKDTSALQGCAHWLIDYTAIAQSNSGTMRPFGAITSPYDRTGWTLIRENNQGLHGHVLLWLLLFQSAVLCNLSTS